MTAVTAPSPVLVAWRKNGHGFAQLMLHQIQQAQLVVAVSCILEGRTAGKLPIVHAS